MNKFKLILIVLGIAGVGFGGITIKDVFEKLKERRQVIKENKVLKAEVKTFNDSLKLHKEWLAKALIDTKNASELYAVTKGMTASFQGVIAVMRDSVIKINKDRAAIDAKLLECQKNLERAQKKRKFL